MTTPNKPSTLAEIADKPLPTGYGVRVAGGRKVYPECGSMWRERSRNYCYVAGVAYAGDWHEHERSRRYLPDDTPVEIVPLP